MQNINTTARELAKTCYALNPHYPIKLFKKFPVPMIGEEDLPGYWYESLYEVCCKHPDKALEPRLLLVMGYRHLCEVFRAKVRKKRLDALDWRDHEGKMAKDLEYLGIELENVLAHNKVEDLEGCLDQLLRR
jgi:hypothetical protein